jgi:glycosidase
MTVPDWIHEAIFYQIFPDRFANGDPGNDPVNVQAWGAEPNQKAYQGGDLSGIIQNLDYLSDLGVNAIYLNPIFHSTANHRYHTVDFKKIDPLLGTLDDFKNLIEEAHKRNIRIILDGVFNHCGRGFFAFADVLENEETSPYKDWFHISSFPLNAYGKGKDHNYIGWWGIKDLPKFNIANTEVREYLFGAIRYWTALGIDGWRLDVPNEIDDDGFWEEFRTEVRNINPEAYLVGEIWDVNPRWVNETHFDGLMNYPLRDAILDVLRGKLEFAALSKVQARIEGAYAENHHLAQYNLLASHDTRRPLSILEGDQEKLKLAYACLFAFPGAPAIYYGDEIGMLGNREPESRGAFSWDKNSWNNDIRDWIKKLIGLRADNISLRRGKYILQMQDEGRQMLAFSRISDEQEILFIANFSNQGQKFDLEENLSYQMKTNKYSDLLTGEKLSGKTINLDPFQARVIAK